MSSTELASTVGADSTNVVKVLKDLEQEDSPSPGRENRRGAGSSYVPTAAALC